MAESTGHAHEALAHHFDSLEQQREAGSLGMWLFLVTEIMFFGGFFCVYIVYRAFNYEGFAVASHELDITLGTINTAILIGSSLTMALAVHYAQIGKKKMLVWGLVLTILLALGFLGIKVVEYAHKIDHGLFPGAGFVWEGRFAREAEMFYSIYFGMTGMHALHMVIGIGVMLVLVHQGIKGKYTPEYHSPVEMTGLYWHFVDIVWIFLFPLLYLIGRH